MKMNNWNKVALSEICDLIAGFAFKSKDFGDYDSKVIKITHITPPSVDMDNLGGVDISKYNAAKLEKFIAKAGDYVLAMTGATIGKIGRIEHGSAYINQRVLLFRPRQNVDKEFLYYALQQYEFGQYITSHADSESAQPNISAGTIGKYQIILPPMEIQKRISTLLRAYDEKRENNRKINDNLQQQAQALYREWFISHLEEHTEQYRKVSLADLMDYAGGSQPPASEFISEQRDGYVRLVQIRDYESNSHVTYIPVSGKNKLCKEHDIMIARYGAALGRICFGLNGAYNVALAKVFPKQKYYREFLRCYLSSREFYEGINNKGGRSAQAGFNQSDIRSFELFIPVDETVIQSFESLVAPIFEKRLHIIKENQSLATLRDTLLPKLMSGEIDVSAVQF